MRKRIGFALIGLVVLFAVARIAYAQVTTNESVDFTGFTVFVPCANGGAGEDVVFTGDLHVLFTTTEDGAGGFHTTFHFQPKGLSGVGQVT